MFNLKCKNGDGACFEDLVFSTVLKGAWVRGVASLFVWLSVLGLFLIQAVDAETLLGVSAVVGCLILTNLPTKVFAKRFLKDASFKYLFLLINGLEVLGYTALIYFLGGIRAAFLTPFYAALITSFGVMASGRLVFLIAGFCAGAYSLMVILEHAGFLPRQNMGLDVHFTLASQIYQLIIITGLLYGAAFISDYGAHLLQKRRGKLHRQNAELKRSREGIREIAEQLKEKNIQLQIATQKAKQSDCLRSEFLSNMSHALRTPLNHIIGFAELILDEKFGELDESRKENLSDVHKSSQHLLSLVVDIVDLSKSASKNAAGR